MITMAQLWWNCGHDLIIIRALSLLAWSAFLTMNLNKHWLVTGYSTEITWLIIFKWKCFYWHLYTSEQVKPAKRKLLRTVSFFWSHLHLEKYAFSLTNYPCSLKANFIHVPLFWLEYFLSLLSEKNMADALKFSEFFQSKWSFFIFIVSFIHKEDESHGIQATSISVPTI